jgi:predicted ATP-grasp superfamily ATP-dependent carboligase
MCTQDLETTADEKLEEKKIEEVRRPQPQWIIKRHL